jgi:WD40 repeat protein
VFGRDLFISYSRRDARRYAPGLALALQKRMPKLSVYLDRWVAPPSGRLPLSLRLQLRWSSILVVVCTENAIGSPFVKDEVARFARLRRKVVTVDVDGRYEAVRGQEPWLGVSGADPEGESGEAVARGEPSENVVERILKSVEFTTQDRRLRRAVWGTLAFVALSVGGTAVYSVETVRAADAKAADAEARAAAAGDRARAAGEKAAAAEGRAEDAERREAEAKRLEEAAVRAQGLAEAKEREASRKAATAEGLRAAAEEKAGRARAEAQRQQTVALARRLATESNPAEDPQLEQTEKKVLLAVEAMRRSPSAGAYRNLVEGIKTMPRPRETVSHDGKVDALTFSPDGRYMATAVGDVLWLRGAGGLARGRGLGDPQKIRHAGPISRLGFSPDGKYLATLARGAGVRVWQTEGMRELPPVPLKGALAFAFSSDGRLIAVAGAGDDPAASGPQKTAVVWELGAAPREVASAETKGAVLDVSFSPDGGVFTTLENDDDRGQAAFNFWDAGGGAQRVPAGAPLAAEGGALRGGFSPNGKYLAVVSQDDRKVAHVWKVRDHGQALRSNQLEFIQFSPDGRFLVTASADDESDRRRTRIWDVSGEEFKELRHINYRSIIREGTFSRDGSRLALVSLERENVQVWDPLVGRVLAYIKLKERRPEVAFTADGKFLALSAGADVTLWPLDGDWKSSEAAHPSGDATALNPGGRLIAVAEGPTVRLFDAKDGRPVSSFETRCDVDAVAFDWEGGRLATAGVECGVWVWRLGGSKEGTPVPARGNHRWTVVRGLAFSRDGRFLAVADGRAYVVEIADPSNSARFGSEDVLSVTFSADGRRIATAYNDGLDIWDWRAPGRRPKHLDYRLLNSDSNEPVVSFGEDGYLFVADDYAAHVWDVSGEPLEIGALDLQDESTSAEYVSALSPGGAFVATTLLNITPKPEGGPEAVTSVWQLQPAAVMANACGRLSRSLTKPEWEKEFGKESYRETCAGVSAASPGRGQ